MADKPEDKKEESTVALEGLQSTLDSLTEKLDTSLTDVNTRLDGVQTKFDDLKPTETQPLAPQTESHVPKGWTPSSDGGWNDVFDQTSKIAKETAATAASTAVNAYKDEVADTKQQEQDKVDAWNKEWETQNANLEKQGRLPKIEKPDDDKDAGEVARKELYDLGLKYKSVDMNAMADLRDALKQKPPAGESAPVGSSARTTAPSKSIDYNKDIRGKTMDDMIADEFQT